MLRHLPELVDAEIDEYSWMKVDLLLKGMKKVQPIKFAELEEIVEADSEHRFSFNKTKTAIKANFGHTLPVTLDLVPSEPPEILYCIIPRAWSPSLERSGLVMPNRNYVVLYEDELTGVCNAFLVSDEISYYAVNAKEMYDNGFEFFYAEDGNWLTETVPPEYRSW